MTEKTKNIIRIAYKTVMSVMLAVSGILLICSCVSIYNLGDRPFTTENISNAFSKIAVPIYATAILAILGVVAAIFQSRKDQPQKSLPDKKKTAERLDAKLDISLCSDEIAQEIKNVKKRIRVSRTIFILISVIALIPAMIYVLLPSSYTMEYNESVICACLWILPCVLVSAAAQIILSYLNSANYDKLISAQKLAIASGAKKSSLSDKIKNESHTSKRIILALRVAVLALSVVFIIDGITNGGFSDVLIKAINICTECIGLG